MKAKSCRPFGLTDVVILIAAAAVSFAWCRWLLKPYVEPGVGLVFKFFPDGTGSARVILQAIRRWNRVASPIAIMGTVALVVLRLRNPRPPFRRLLRQPGVAACATMCWVTLVRVVGSGLVQWDAVDRSWLGWLDDLEYIVWDMNEWASISGSVIATVWVVLLASRHWKREAGWIDRFGICLGVYWITAAPFSWFADLSDFP